MENYALLIKHLKDKLGEYKEKFDHSKTLKEAYGWQQKMESIKAKIKHLQEEEYDRFGIKRKEKETKALENWKKKQTLREYLESYDEPLNEGIGDKIKGWFNKSKDFFKSAAIAIAAVSFIWSSLSVGQAPTIAKFNNADRDNLKTYVREIKTDISKLKKDYKDLQEVSKYFTSAGEAWEWQNLKPSSEIEQKMFNLFKMADDRLSQSAKVLKKYQYKNFADIIFSQPKELAAEIKNASNCMKTVKKSIEEIAQEHKNNREVLNKHHNW